MLAEICTNLNHDTPCWCVTSSMKAKTSFAPRIPFSLYLLVEGTTTESSASDHTSRGHLSIAALITKALAPIAFDFSWCDPLASRHGDGCITFNVIRSIRVVQSGPEVVEVRTLGGIYSDVTVFSPVPLFCHITIVPRDRSPQLPRSTQSRLRGSPVWVDMEAFSKASIRVNPLAPF